MNLLIFLDLSYNPCKNVTCYSLQVKNVKIFPIFTYSQGKIFLILLITRAAHICLVSTRSSPFPPFPLPPSHWLTSTIFQIIRVRLILIKPLLSKMLLNSKHPVKLHVRPLTLSGPGGGAQRPGWPNSQLPIRNLLSYDAQTW